MQYIELLANIYLVDDLHFDMLPLVDYQTRGGRPIPAFLISR